ETSEGRDRLSHLPQPTRLPHPKFPGGYRFRVPKSEQILEVADRKVTITNPEKVFFPHTGHTKLDLGRYYLGVADGALRGLAWPPGRRPRDRGVSTCIAGSNAGGPFPRFDEPPWPWHGRSSGEPQT